MKRWQKVLLGLGSHWLFIYMPVLLVVFFTSLAMHGSDHGTPTTAFVVGMIALGVIHILSIFFMFATIGVFITYAVKHPRFTSNDRILWALLLAFAGAIAGPVFYWLYIHKHPIGEPFFGTQP